MIISALTDVGLVRDNNEDSFFKSVDLDLPLFIIADGMGGHKAGKTASEMAVEIIKECFIRDRENLKKEDRLLFVMENAIKKANREIYQFSIDDELYSGMGTTITLAYILNQNIYIGHVGDSRAYLIREGAISQLTEDHSLVYELIKNGSITVEEGKNHPQRNMITRAVGTDSSIIVDMVKKKFNKDDILLLSSDGLTNMVSDIEILKTFNREKDIDMACKKLINKAKDNGGMDNITVIAIELGR